MSLKLLPEAINGRGLPQVLRERVPQTGSHNLQCPPPLVLNLVRGSKGAAGGVVMEEVPNVAGSQSVEGLVGDQQQPGLDSKGNRKPVQVSQDGSHVS